MTTIAIHGGNASGYEQIYRKYLISLIYLIGHFGALRYTLTNAYNVSLVTTFRAL